MPCYDFECLQCRASFESWQRAEESPPPCPTCHGETRRLLSAPYVHTTAARGREQAMRSLDHAQGTCACQGCKAK